MLIYVNIMLILKIKKLRHKRLSKLLKVSSARSEVWWSVSTPMFLAMKLQKTLQFALTAHTDLPHLFQWLNRFSLLLYTRVLPDSWVWTIISCPTLTCRCFEITIHESSGLITDFTRITRAKSDERLAEFNFSNKLDNFLQLPNSLVPDIQIQLFLSMHFSKL